MKRQPHEAEDPEAHEPEADSAPDADARNGAEDKLGQRLKDELAPRLQVIRCLGSGTKASVFLAREPELKRLVAIKVLSPALTEDPRARARFEREAQAAASLSHPNIVAVHSVGRLSDGAPYIVMQYVKGRTMAERLEAEGTLSVKEGRRVLSEIASALAAAHRKGIVHRDVRPVNVLHEEETDRCLLADFGIAGVLWTGDQEPAARLTRTGELVGDPTWMSPEQLKGESLTERSDVYGLGLLGYALLAKRSPYDSSSRQALVRAHVRDSPRRLCELRDGVDAQLDDLLVRCLAKQSEHRPNAADIAQRLAMPAPVHVTPDPLSPQGLLARLTERRVPQIVVLYIVLAWGALSVIDQLADRKVLPELVYKFSLVSLLSGLPAVLVGAWFHGKKGDQPVRKVEYWLFGALALIWLVTSALVYLRFAAA